MATKTNSTHTQALLTLFDLQTGFFGRALDDVSADDLHQRLNTQANHMAWLAGSLVAQRYLMASEIRPDLKQTRADLFDNHKSIQADVRYPSPDEYLADWDRITPYARQALVAIDDARLDSDIDMGGMVMTWYDMICFSIYREASIIGQLALWRRLLNYPALKY